jgi:hypothetical protein
MGCRGCGEQPAAPLFTRKSSTAPELRYLNAKLAALLPFGKVADLLNEVLLRNPWNVWSRSRPASFNALAAVHTGLMSRIKMTDLLSTDS